MSQVSTERAGPITLRLASAHGLEAAVPAVAEATKSKAPLATLQLGFLPTGPSHAQLALPPAAEVVAGAAARRRTFRIRHLEARVAAAGEMSLLPASFARVS